MYIDDASAVKMVVMAKSLLDLCWSGPRLKRHFMKFVTKDNLPGTANSYVSLVFQQLTSLIY